MMQRAFSFQTHDDDPAYRALPLTTPADSSLPLSPPSPPRPPLHASTPRFSGEYEQQQPLRGGQYTPTKQGFFKHTYQYSHGHARHDSSSSSSSSDSSVSSISQAGLGAPSPRTYQLQENTPIRPSNSIPRNLISGGNTGHPEQYWDPDTDYPRGAYFMAPSDQYPPQRHSPSDTLYTPHSASPMSQTQIPLMSASSTPSSRFADAPAPPAHRDLANAVLPPTPPHRIGMLENRSSDRVLNNPVGGHYTDNPYNRYSTTWDPQLSASQVHVEGTARDAETFVFSDDEEETFRGGGAAGGGMPPIAGGAVGGATGDGRGGDGTYYGGDAATGIYGEGTGGGADGRGVTEKAMPSDWLQKQAHSKKKTRWIVGLVLLLIILAAVAGATAGVLVSKKNSKGGGGAATAGSTGSITSGGGGGLTESEDVAQNGDLNKDSAEIKALMSNDKLKKVFHGMDYTPLNSQYPECIHNPPTQNNITRDIAVMSLLTDKLRLYGTDCNQTEMVLHAIDVLDIKMKIWLGVWLDSNTTTNSRQLNHLYTLLGSYPADRFEGVAVGNEVLFREELTETELFSTIADVRANLSSLSIDLPVGTSDLGSNWKSTMVPYVDVLMANVHPFFAGVVVEKAADWTWNFFETNDVILTQNVVDKPRVMISEVGWPSAGGRNTGSVAGISQMNRFMEDFVCAENKKGTEYFWFSAFDEPWKVKFNEPGKEWEDKWGLMDVDRNLKDGLVIPDCL